LRVAVPLLVIAVAVAIGAFVFAGGDQSNPSPSSSEGEIYSDTEPHVSPDEIELSRLLATGEHTEPEIGDRIEIDFSLKNVGSESVTLDETFIAARDPDDGDEDFGHENEGKVFAPGDVLEISRSVVVDAPGVWKFWPCYSLSASPESTGCPDEWRSFEVFVAKSGLQSRPGSPSGVGIHAAPVVRSDSSHARPRARQSWHRSSSENALIAYAQPMAQAYLCSLEDVAEADDRMIDRLVDELSVHVERGALWQRSQLALEGIRVTSALRPRRGITLRALSPAERGLWVRAHLAPEAVPTVPDFAVPLPWVPFTPRVVVDWVDEVEAGAGDGAGLHHRLALAFFLRG
jgi:hypothetical protein